MERTTLLINRPFYLGFTVLEFSKLHIYDTHYNYFVPLYGRCCTLINSDPDSPIYQIRTEDVNLDCYEFRGEVFDMSTYPSSHPLFDGTFKDVPGKFKIETKCKIYAENVSLSPENYSYRLLDPEKLT